MQMSALLAVQRILLANWVIGPGLGIWIWVRDSGGSAIMFLVLWLIVDRVCDRFTGFLLAMAARHGPGREEDRAALYGEVPNRVALLMITDLLGALLIPWLIAGTLLA